MNEGEEIIFICDSDIYFDLFETTGQFVRKKLLLEGELVVEAVKGLERADEAGLFFKGDCILYY